MSSLDVFPAGEASTPFLYWIAGGLQWPLSCWNPWCCVASPSCGTKWPSVCASVPARRRICMPPGFAIPGDTSRQPGGSPTVNPVQSPAWIIPRQASCPGPVGPAVRLAPVSYRSPREQPVGSPRRGRPSEDRPRRSPRAFGPYRPASQRPRARNPSSLSRPSRVKTYELKRFPLAKSSNLCPSNRAGASRPVGRRRSACGKTKAASCGATPLGRAASFTLSLPGPMGMV